MRLTLSKMRNQDELLGKMIGKVVRTYQRKTRESSWVLPRNSNLEGALDQLLPRADKLL